MHFTEILAKYRPTISFEFFPPNTDQSAENLFETVSDHFQNLQPSFITVTYGAGGTTRERTRKLVIHLTEDIDTPTIPHLACIGSTRNEMATVLQSYVSHGIKNVVALRGDPIKDQKGMKSEFTYASDLVTFIKAEFPQLGIAVAGYPEGHPETPNPLDDLDNLKYKVDAGADLIITQLFFDNRDYYDFAARCRLENINVPILAGLMPIQSTKGIKRMAGLSGSRLPAPLLRSLKRAQNNEEAIKRVGTHWATEQCRDLLDHDVAGIHLYTLNQSSATRNIYANLGITHTGALHE